MDLEHLLRQRFGHPTFRDGQLPIIEHITQGNDALVVMPTGAGKSLCYQLPALARGGVTLVVSPLLALMKDQVDALVAKGVRAAFINSTLDPAQRAQRIQAVLRGEIELLYVAPERFGPGFLQRIRGADIRLLAIDEAHCLSQWGHDFRPDYLRLGQVRHALGDPPTVALTATATRQVQDDIVRTLDMAGCRRFIQGFDRPNLSLEVAHVTSLQDKLSRLPALVGASGSTLIYCATRRNVERVGEALRGANVRIGLYHGGMNHTARVQVQEDFMTGRVPVVVATNAFGMGVDKDDVRAIIHFDLPGTIEAYYQEIGRAGRDGLPSRVVLLFRESDKRTQEFFIQSAHPPAADVRAVWQAMVDRAQNPIWASPQQLADDLGGALSGDGDPRLVQSCLSALQRTGRISRLPAASHPPSVQLRPDAPHRSPDGIMGATLSWLHHQASDRPDLPLDVHLPHAAADLQTTPDHVDMALRGLQRRGYLHHQPGSDGPGYQLIDPAHPLDLDEQAMAERRRHDLRKLEQMLGYADAGCRRRYLLEYFGQQAPWERCGTCDACRAGKAMVHGPKALTPEQALVVTKLLSVMARIDRPHSAKIIAKVATGAADSGVRRWGYERHSTYGVLRGWTQPAVEQLLGALTRAGAIDADLAHFRTGDRDITYRNLSLSPLGQQLMRGRAPDFRMVFPTTRTKRKATGRKAVEPVLAPADADLLGQLRAVRLRLARDSDVPAYVVAPNKTLAHIAQQRPTTREALLACHGMGPERTRRYGPALLQAVREWTGG